MVSVLLVWERSVEGPGDIWQWSHCSGDRTNAWTGYYGWFILL